MYIEGQIGDRELISVPCRIPMPVPILDDDCLAIRILAQAAENAVTWEWHDQLVAEISRIRAMDGLR